MSRADLKRRQSELKSRMEAMKVKSRPASPVLVDGWGKPVQPAMARMRPSQANVEQKFKEQRKQLRAALAQDLKAARQRLRSLKAEISSLQPVVSQLYNLRITVEQRYPEIPISPLLQATEDARGIPASTGVYFIWSNGILVYVGQSTCLHYRLRLGNHDAIESDDLISYILLEKKDLSFAESYYIGIARPPRNFGGWKKWKAASAGV